MRLDAFTRFSSSQALTATAIGTNVYDLGVATSAGTGEPIAVVFTVIVAADQTTGDEDYTFDVETCTDTLQTTGIQLLGRRVFESGTPTAPAQDADLLVAGFQFNIIIPPVTAGETARYLGVRYRLAGTTPTITMTADMVPATFIQQNTTYAKGYSIT
jgi:hypothetical protein